MKNTSHTALGTALQASADEILGSNTARHISVAEGYQRWAPTYDSDPNPLLAREERYLWPLFDQVHCERVLDLGCGTGRWLRRLAARSTICAVGIDNSVPMLRVASAEKDLAGKVANADCKQLPFPHAFFDLIISSFVLSHLPNLKLVVAELARVTKPGAQIYVSDLHPKAYDCGWRVGFRNGLGTFEIESVALDTDALFGAFHSEGFEPLNVLDLWLDQPEKSIFEAAGKAHRFRQACQVPAILCCHFQRIAQRSQAMPVLGLEVPV